MKRLRPSNRLTCTGAHVFCGVVHLSIFTMKIFTMKILYIVLTAIVCTGGLAYGAGEDASRSNAQVVSDYSVDVIVIDPGHGGSDVGAISKNGLYEKDITLKIARSLGEMIREGLNIKVFLTREVDEYASLGARRRFADKMNADLFISIHANSSEYISISGCETFFYKKDASDEQARLLAELENKGGMSDDDDLPNPVEFILMDMANSELIQLSYKFATIIQKNYVSGVKSPDRGVKQAPFMVLMGARMPAVLTEIGFLSSKKDERKLKNYGYLDDIAKSLFKSIKRYKSVTDTKNGKDKRVETQ